MRNIYFLCIGLSLFIFDLHAEINMNQGQSLYIDSYVPSLSTGLKGIAIRIFPVANARYGQCGAPIAVCLVGGDESDQINADFGAIDFASQGMIKVLFNYPGGGTGLVKSGGTYDNRGNNCILATYDVLQFVTGLITDNNGNYIYDLLSSSGTPDINNVGLIGSSNGGNMALIVSAMYGDKLPGLKWIANWESPVGDGHYTGDKGSATDGVNVAYIPGTTNIPGNFSWSKLKYSKNVIPVKTSLATIQGGLYFDNDNDGVYSSSSTDFSLHGWYANCGTSTSKVYYSEEVMNHSVGLIPNTNLNFATVSEVQQFWSIRNAEYFMNDLLTQRPDLYFILMASEIDHVQVAVDRAHLLAQYSPLNYGGLQFVRLNPDEVYISNIKGASIANTSDNNAFSVFDYTSIQNTSVLETENADYSTLVLATASELSDRVFTNNIDSNLINILPSQCLPTSLLPITIFKNNKETTMMLKIYPNPTTGIVKLEFQGTIQDILIDCYDLMGNKIISSSNHASIVTQLDLSAFKNGIYFLRIKNGDETFIERVIK